jgi:hypothetical protein
MEMNGLWSSIHQKLKFDFQTNKIPNARDSITATSAYLVTKTWAEIWFDYTCA